MEVWVDGMKGPGRPVTLSRFPASQPRQAIQAPYGERVSLRPTGKPRHDETISAIIQSRLLKCTFQPPSIPTRCKRGCFPMWHALKRVAPHCKVLDAGGLGLGFAYRPGSMTDNIYDTNNITSTAMSTLTRRPSRSDGTDLQSALSRGAHLLIISFIVNLSPLAPVPDRAAWASSRFWF